MIRIETIADVRQLVREARQSGKTIGFVPTMGYLHEGHLTLVEAAKRACDFVVVSIFVNPLQFGPNEDLEKYPRNIERDSNLLSETGHADVLFNPSVDEMYPMPMATSIDLPELGAQLCGRTRLTHFKGVATVVNKLFNIVQPDFAFFGQKDGQQVAIIKRMVKDLSMPTEIIVVPTVRESSGLAKSSRNIYLSPEEREHATILHQSLMWAKEQIERGERSGLALAQGIRERIEADPLAKLDYAEVVSLDTLLPMTHLQGPIMMAVAVYFGKARLIDNFQLNI